MASELEAYVGRILFAYFISRLATVKQDRGFMLQLLFEPYV